MRLNYREQIVFEDPQASITYEDATIDRIINTPLGKEMDILEAEADLYDMNTGVGWLNKEDPIETFFQCFNVEYAGFFANLRSSTGRLPWSATIRSVYMGNDITAAGKFIIARAEWLRVRDAIRSLPQPIAEEIEEQLEFTWR